MKGQSGKTPLDWIIILIVTIILVAVAIAMFHGNEKEVIDNVNQTINSIDKK